MFVHLSWVIFHGSDLCNDLELWGDFSKRVGFFCLNPAFGPQKYVYEAIEMPRSKRYFLPG